MMFAARVRVRIIWYALLGVGGSDLMMTANDGVRGSGFGYYARRYLAQRGPILASFLCGLALSAAGAAAAETRHPLLVYYGDETSAQAAQSENYAALLEVLRSSDSPRAAIVAESIGTDAERFPLLVQRDIEVLKVQAKRLGFDLAVFTNALAFDGTYLLLRVGTGLPETHRLPEIPPALSTILATSPLSRPEYLRAALLSVGTLYPANSLDIVLITNSHGGRDMALIPRVNADLSQSGAAVAMRQMLESDDNGLPPAWAQSQGTSKLAYWQILKDVSAAHGVRFPLVFRETCVSGIRSFTELFAIPDSIGLIAHSAMEPLNGWDLDYAQLLKTARPGSDWIASLSAALERDGIHVDTWWTAWSGVLLIALRSIPLAVFFIPLALWIAWYAFGRRFRRRLRLAWAKSW